MKNKGFWKTLVILAVAWALWESYPPSGRDLLQVFQEQAQSRDTNFTAIVTRAAALQKEFPERAYGNLFTAIGTNDIKRYFPSWKTPANEDPTRVILNRVQQKAAGKIKLGLDLRGGTSFLVQMETNRLASPENREAALNKAVEILRRRVDKLGVAEPLIQPAGEDKILVALPGLSEAENQTARTQIEKAAFLEFRMVHPDSDNLVSQGIPAPGYELLKIKPRKDEGNKQPVPYLVKIKPERGLTGKHVKFARVNRHPVSNEPEIHFTMDDEGGRLFAEITKEFSPQGNKYSLLGIVLDGELLSAPRILSEIPGGSGTITGNFDVKEAFDLATALENPLEAPVKIREERRVDPSLGRDSIRSGITASIIGTLLVVAFMMVYYRFAGVVANVAVVLNIIILLGVMCSINTTLTIPGIAGIVLTIGMAVDANVLIYERIREELEAGKSMRGALIAGYDKACGTIFDSNLTTLISSVILIIMGTGSVKGFGVTLTIGLTVSMFTALVVTRLIFDWLLDKGTLTKLPMMALIKNTQINFVKAAKLAFTLSWSLILVGCLYGAYRGKDVLGVEFTGGDSLTLSFAQKIDNVDEIRTAITKAGINEAMIQYQRDLGSATETLRIAVPEDMAGKAEAALNAQFPNAKFQRKGLDKIGATVGKEIQKAAIVSILLSLFGILIYVAMRYEFSFAVGAVIAIIHDILMTLGCFFMWGGQFSATMVAAILTIIGFSINDTIVIFDRIREDLRLGLRGSFTELINHALNKTLSRTIITSGTVFLATFSLYVFGGGVIHDFAFTFLVGIVTGTYSSIYIASTLVLWWHKGERPAIGASMEIDGTAGASPAPAKS